MYQFLAVRSKTITSLVLIFSLFSPLSNASIIPAELVINGNVELALSPVDGSLPALGPATQNATMSRVIGGTLTEVQVIDIAPLGPNPLGGVLTDIGDGVGNTADVNASSFGLIEAFIFDFTFSLTNTSLTDSFLTSFIIDFSNTVQAFGFDSYVDSEIALFDSLDNEFFASDISSDTLFGDQKNGVDLPTSGAQINDVGLFSFDIALAAGQSTSFSGFMKIEGEDFGDGSFNALSSAFISVADVQNTTPPGPGPNPQPNPIPEPTSVLLFLTGSLGLMARKSWKPNN